MARSWETLRRLYVQSVGDTPRSREEAWDHLGEAHRLVLSAIPDAERSTTDTDVTVAAGADSILVSTIGFSVYAIQDIFNVTDGIAMKEEPSGMRGRNAFLEKTTGKPPSGTVTHYARDDVSLYLRNTPSVTTTLRVRGLRQAADLSNADLAGVPVSPQQYDRAIVCKAAELYFLLHPNENMVPGEGGRTTLLSDKHGRAFSSLMPLPTSARAEEDKNRTERFRLAGFRFGR